MIAIKKHNGYSFLDNLDLRNNFSAHDFDNIELFQTRRTMKNSNKIKYIEKLDFLEKNLSKKLCNRAIAQIRRRLREYANKKKDYDFKSGYINHLLTNLIPLGAKRNRLKKYTLPLIASFIVTDGYMGVRKKKGMDVLEIGLANKNIELINTFNDLIFLTYKEIPSCVGHHSQGMKRTVFVASWHKPMIEDIKRYCYKNGKKTIKNLLNSDKKILLECLRIALSCDGFVTFYVSKDRYGFKGKRYYNRIRKSIELGCKPTELKEDWKKLGDKLGLRFNIKKDRIKCSHHESIENFFNMGGFIPNTLIGDNSKYFKNVDKNKALETLIMAKKKRLNNIISNENEEKLLIDRTLKELK